MRKGVKAAVAAGLAALSGCATEAKQQFEADRATITDFSAKMAQCQKDAGANPAMQSLWAHTPPTGKPDLGQLADQTLMTSEQRPIYLAWRTEVERCRSNAAELGSVDPSIVSTMEGGWSAADAVRVKLLSQQITWGDANEQIATVAQRTDASVTADIQSTGEALQEQNADELQRRASAFQAMSQALQQQQAAQQQQMQNQQIINSINRPVSTTCNSIGSQTSCTSN